METLILIKVNKKIKLNNKSIILGIEQDKQYENLNRKEVYLINEIIIIAKLSISKSKMNNSNITLTFERELSLRNKMN